MNTLMLTHVVSCLPTARHMSLMCSSGPQGYDALKEMMNNGMPGRTLLFESDDLHAVDSSAANCCLVYVYNTTDELEGAQNFRECLSPSITQVTVFWDTPSPPSYLLAYCEELQSVILSPLLVPLSVPVILCSFLEGCTGLKEIDLTPLSGVVEVGESFLEGCTGLVAIDLKPLSQLEVAHACFLGGCSGLKSIDFSPLSEVKFIDTFFMSGCTGITSVDLTPFSKNLVVLSSSFLSGCPNLKKLDLSSLTQLNRLPYDIRDRLRGGKSKSSGGRGGDDRCLILLPRHLENYNSDDDY